MGLFRRTLSLAAICLPLAAFPYAAHANDVDTQFTFTGTCAVDDCAYSSATLTVDDYTPGDEFTTDNFVSFTYASDIEQFEIDSDGLGGFFGSIGSTTGAYDVTIFGTDTDSFFSAFESQTDGSWCADCLADTGPDHSWSEVSGATPEPSSIALLMTGMAALPFVRRRMLRSKTA